MEERKKHEIHWVNREDANFPERLKKLTGMPKKLYYIGNLPDPAKPSAAVVGARMSSPYGRCQAFKYARTMAEHGVQIISGMARGIDSEGHKGALDTDTPRISGIMHVENGSYSYAMSILKSNNGDPSSCNRYTFAYQNAKAGEGHFIHTYKCDGNPLPSFEGEPKLVAIPDDMDAFAGMLWESLNEDNKVSLFVRYIDIATGKYETKIINKNH